MDRSILETWLQAYGEAWEQRDSDAFTSLFAQDVEYHWTPFGAPRRGRSMLADAFDSAVARQRDIRFEATSLAVVGNRGIAHWHCSFDRAGTDRRVHLDGVFLMDFDEGGSCRVFREWWHSDEPA